METENKISIKEQEEILSLIGRTLEKRAEGYVVGGTAMMFLGLKEITKDIDIIFKEKEDYENFKNALLKLGAKEPKYKLINPEKVSAILTLGNARFDLFLDYLISFKLTETIISRVIEVHEFSNLIIKVVNPEDIILFKSFAGREGDKIDAANIIRKTNVNWEVILKEAEDQTKDSKYFFVVFLHEFLRELKEDFDTEIPNEFFKELRKLSKLALSEAEKRLKK